MRDIRRRLATERPRMALRRTADGRLAPASKEADIADIWADQKRVQLREAMEAEKRKAQKRQRRRERLSGGQEVEIRLHLPSLPSREQITGWAGKAARALRAVLRAARRNRRKALAIAVLAVLLFGVPVSKLFSGIVGTSADNSAATKKSSAIVLSEQSQTPDFPTVLPVDKKIEDLGGWGRVSPPDNAPVYAYSDSVAGAHIVVSEQRLPDSFGSDLHGQLAKAAKQFGASKEVTTTDHVTMFLGTAANGSQSVVTSKKGLLIFIRSTAVISDDLWSDYVFNLELSE